MKAETKKQLKQATKIQNLKKEQINRALRSLFKTTDGKELLKLLMTLYPKEANPFDPDSAVTNFRCGEQSVQTTLDGLLLNALDKQYYALLMEIHNEQRATAQSAAGPDTSTGTDSESTGRSETDGPSTTGTDYYT